MVFRYPSDPNVNYIKRVVGLPGDVIRYTSDKRLFINGESVAEKLIGAEPNTLGSAELYQEKLGAVEHEIRKEMSRYRAMPDGEWKVPAGHYFMMGDNRDTLDVVDVRVAWVAKHHHIAALRVTNRDDFLVGIDIGQVHRGFSTVYVGKHAFDGG